MISPGLVGNEIQADQDILVSGPSCAKFPRTGSSVLGNSRASLEGEIPTEIKSLLVESQKELLRLLKPKTNENIRKELENETRNFYTPTKLVSINSTQNNDSCASRNMMTGVLNDSTNQPKRAKIRSQSQPASKELPAVARTLFATDKNDETTLPLPKALTESLPTFDGKSEKFELFKNLFFQQ